MKSQKELSNAFHWSMWIILAALCLIFFAPDILKEGMFSDGLVYSTISRNLAFGKGEVFKPMLTQTVWNPFYEHPSGGFIIQSLFFLIFGNDLSTERIFATFTLVILGVLIATFWKILCPKEIKLIWFPLILLLLVPCVPFYFARNMLENITTTLNLATVIVIYVSFNRSYTVQLMLWLAAALLLFISFMTKGVVTLFPLAVPLLYYIFILKTNYKKILSSYFVVITVFILFVVISLQNKQVDVFWHKYIDNQLIASMLGKRNEHGSASRWGIILKLAEQLIIMCMGLLTFIPLFFQTRFVKTSAKDMKFFWFLIAVGLSASIPIVFSIKQATYYLVPSFPYFALAVAYFMHRNLAKGIANIKRFHIVWLYKPFAFFLLLAGLSISVYFSFQSRNADLIGDVKTMSKHFSPNTTLGTLCAALDSTNHYNLHAYLYRYGYISIDSSFKEHKYYLVLKNNHCSYSKQRYKELDLGLKTMRVLKEK